MDAYKILGAAKNASREQIDAAYRDKVKRYHPDKGGEAWAFQQVQEAYETLTINGSQAGFDRAAAEAQNKTAEAEKAAAAARAAREKEDVERAAAAARAAREKADAERTAAATRAAQEKAEVERVAAAHAARQKAEEERLATAAQEARASAEAEEAAATARARREKAEAERAAVAAQTPREKAEPRKNKKRLAILLPLGVALAVIAAAVVAYKLDSRASQRFASTPNASAEPPVGKTNSLGMKLVLIRAGEFMMGSPDLETGRSADEQQHRVKITKPFYMGKYAVTQSEYEQIMGSNPSWFSATGGGRQKVEGIDTSWFPVEQVSWNDASEFCRKLSAREGKQYRLPTEAEWEYSCRAARTTTAFNFGGSLNGAMANCDGSFPFGTEMKGENLGRPTAVGSYCENAWGLYDMHGNIQQWCQDWYGGDYYNTFLQTDNPQGPPSGSARVIRGGGWNFRAVYCRSAHRTGDAPAHRRAYIGFRVVCEG